MDERILLLALRGRDAQVIEQLLSRQGRVCKVCQSGDALADALTVGAGAALITEESLAETDRRRLALWLQQQASWSDFPFILLATKRGGRRSEDASAALRALGNVVVLERPVHGETLASAVDAALRARRRQYDAQRRLIELETAEESLRQLNGSLESQIALRTDDLSKANNQLMQEIAERERAQASLLQAQKIEAMGQLTGGIAHDFNNLLTVICGNLELIQRRADDAKIARLADFARQSADRAAKLTGQLLAFSRTQRLTLAPVDVDALVRGMDDLLARTIGPMFTVDMQLEADGAWAVADANQVELAILNLVINARDAMPDGGPLTISSTVQSAQGTGLDPGDYVVIRIKDQGAGIAPHILERVFDPFFTTKPMGKGTGLGLSQVYGLAEQSGGTARVDSVEGVGTTVEMWLPQAAPARPALADAPTAAPIPRGKRRQVLVVEDDDAVRRFIVECLDTLGYAVIEASNGQMGLDRIREAPPELLIVDFAMPGLNGAQVIASAKLMAPDLPIILATGYADMDAVNSVIDSRHVLRKPFRIEDLEAALLGALAD